MGPPGGLLGRKARACGSWSPSGPPLGPVLGPSWAILGASWAVLGPSWAVLGPSWKLLGPSWGGLGRLLGRPVTSESPKDNFVENVRFTKGMGQFLRLGALLGRMLEASWGLLGASLDVWRPSSASRSPLGGLLEVSWAVLGASWAVLSDWGGLRQAPTSLQSPRSPHLWSWSRPRAPRPGAPLYVY